jgi:hypothetical protein
VLAIVCAALPGVAGKFWGYHWLPLGYAAMLLASLACAGKARPLSWRHAGAVVLLVAALALPVRAWTPDTRRQAELACVDRLTAFLAGTAKPGDQVQPLDWNGTAPHAMLLARLQIATPFVEDVHFYHHAAHPFVRNLRDRLMHPLRLGRPRFILEMPAPGWAPSPDSRHPFDELAELLREHYRVAATADGFVVYERIPRP